MKSCIDDDDDNGFEKIQRAKLDSKEFGVGDVEEDGHRQGTGALEKNVRLQKNTKEILESGSVEHQVTSLDGQDQELLRQSLYLEQYCNSHPRSKFLGLLEEVGF